MLYQHSGAWSLLTVPGPGVLPPLLWPGAPICPKIGKGGMARGSSGPCLSSPVQGKESRCQTDAKLPSTIPQASLLGGGQSLPASAGWRPHCMPSPTTRSPLMLSCGSHAMLLQGARPDQEGGLHPVRTKRWTIWQLGRPCHLPLTVIACHHSSGGARPPPPPPGF